MTRVKTGPHRRRRHQKIVKSMQGQFGSRHRLWRRANESMLKSYWYAYRDRRVRKRDLRRLWIIRINAAVRQHGISYSIFMHKLREANVELNRKTLADLAVRDPNAFSAVADLAIKQ